MVYVFAVSSKNKGNFDNVARKLFCSNKQERRTRSCVTKCITGNKHVAPWYSSSSSNSVAKDEDTHRYFMCLSSAFFIVDKLSAASAHFLWLIKYSSQNQPCGTAVKCSSYAGSRGAFIDKSHSYALLNTTRWKVKYLNNIRVKILRKNVLSYRNV